MIELFEIDVSKTTSPICFECGFWESSRALYQFAFDKDKGLFYTRDNSEEWFLPKTCFFVGNSLWIWRKDGFVYMGENQGTIFKIYAPDP